MAVNDDLWNKIRLIRTDVRNAADDYHLVSLKRAIILAKFAAWCVMVLCHYENYISLELESYKRK